MKFFLAMALIITSSLGFAREEVTRDEFKKAVKDHMEMLKKLEPGMAKNVETSVTYEMQKCDDDGKNCKAISCSSNIKKTITLLAKIRSTFYVQNTIVTTLAEGSAEECVMGEYANDTYLTTMKMHRRGHGDYHSDLTLDKNLAKLLALSKDDDEESDMEAKFFKVEESMYDVEISKASKNLKLMYSLDLTKSIFFNPLKLSVQKGETYSMSSEIIKDYTEDVESIDLSSTKLCFKIPVPREDSEDKKRRGKLVCTPEGDYSFILE